MSNTEWACGWDHPSCQARVNDAMAELRAENAKLTDDIMEIHPRMVNAEAENARLRQDLERALANHSADLSPAPQTGRCLDKLLLEGEWRQCKLADWHAGAHDIRGVQTLPSQVQCGCFCLCQKHLLKSNQYCQHDRAKAGLAQEQPTQTGTPLPCGQCGRPAVDHLPGYKCPT